MEPTNEILVQQLEKELSATYGPVDSLLSVDDWSDSFEEIETDQEVSELFDD